MSKRLSNCLDDKLEIEACLSKQYKSAYQPYISSVRIECEAFQFRQRECIINSDGNVDIIQHKHTETILIAKHWQRYISEGTCKGGYIVKGLSKFAFKVRLPCLTYMFSDDLLTLIMAKGFI